jgi:uncharacterized SAM-binding protein YcdF (DUF218 family)
MSIPLLSILLCLGFGLRFFHYRKLSISCFSLTIILFIAIAAGWPQRPLLHYLQRDFLTPQHINWQNHNIIVLLCGGEIPVTTRLVPSTESFGRILKSAQLYTACKNAHKNCTIIVSGGNPQDYQDSEANAYAQELIELGIPQKDIQFETNSNNTFEEAEYLKDTFKKLDNTQVILVTSAYHLKRSLYIFKAFGIDTVPVASDYASIDTILAAGHNIAVMDSALHEWIGIAWYFCLIGIESPILKR